MTDGLCRVTSVLCKDHEAVVTAEGTPYTVTPSDLEALGITGPCDITPETLDALACASERLCCIKKAMDHLSYGDMPSRRLLSKLCKRFDKTLAESVVGLLKDRGYLDDTALAARYADSFYHVRMWGPVRIKSELCGRGFDLRVASEAAAAYEERDHTENIINLLEKKFGIPSPSSREQKARAFTYLYRYGYASSDITDAISKIEQEEWSDGY